MFQLMGYLLRTIYKACLCIKEEIMECKKMHLKVEYIYRFILQQFLVI